MVAVLVALLFPSAFAQAAVTSSVKGISISPPLKQVTLGPGLLEATTDVTVKNTTGWDLKGSVELVDFQALNEFGGVSLDQVGAPVTKYSLAHWMHLPEGSTLSIANGQSATIPVTIENTKDLAPGGHYGAVVLSVNTAGQASNSVGLKQELVSLLFVNKSGGDVYGLQLLSLEPNHKGSIPQDVTLRFKSTGNVHVVPRGYIEVTDPRGVLVAKGIINPESTLILPGTARQFVTIMQPVANSSASGRYKITAHYRYDGQDKYSTESLYFTRGSGASWLKIGLITGLVLLIASLFYVFKVRRR